jgi:hypothetical protein
MTPSARLSRSSVNSGLLWSQLSQLSHLSGSVGTVGSLPDRILDDVEDEATATLVSMVNSTGRTSDLWEYGHPPSPHFSARAPANTPDSARAVRGAFPQWYLPSSSSSPSDKEADLDAGAGGLAPKKKRVRPVTDDERFLVDEPFFDPALLHSHISSDPDAATTPKLTAPTVARPPPVTRKLSAGQRSSSSCLPSATDKSNRGVGLYNKIKQSGVHHLSARALVTNVFAQTTMATLQVAVQHLHRHHPYTTSTDPTPRQSLSPRT